MKKHRLLIIFLVAITLICIYFYFKYRSQTKADKLLSDQQKEQEELALKQQQEKEELDKELKRQQEIERIKLEQELILKRKLVQEELERQQLELEQKQQQEQERLERLQQEELKQKLLEKERLEQELIKKYKSIKKQAEQELTSLVRKKREEEQLKRIQLEEEIKLKQIKQKELELLQQKQKQEQQLLLQRQEEELRLKLEQEKIVKQQRFEEEQIRLAKQKQIQEENSKKLEEARQKMERMEQMKLLEKQARERILLAQDELLNNLDTLREDYPILNKLIEIQTRDTKIALGKLLYEITKEDILYKDKKQLESYITNFIHDFLILNDIRKYGIPQFDNFEVDLKYNFNILSMITNNKTKWGSRIPITTIDLNYFNNDDNFYDLLNPINTYIFKRYNEFMKENERFLIKNGNLGKFKIFYDWFSNENNQLEEFIGYVRRSEDINQFLIDPIKFRQNNDIQLINETINTIKQVDIAFSKIPPLPVDIVVYRGIGYDIFNRYFKTVQIGDILRFPNFTSTSWLKEIALRFIGRNNQGILKRPRLDHLIPNTDDCITCCLQKIYVPKGSLLFIPPQFRNEEELIFNQFANFKLLGFSEELFMKKDSRLISEIAGIEDEDIENEKDPEKKYELAKQKYRIDCKDKDTKLRIIHLEFVGYDEKALNNFYKTYIY